MADLRDKLYSLQYTYAWTLNASGFEHDALLILLDLLSHQQNLTPYRRGLCHLLISSISLDKVFSVDENENGISVDVEKHAIDAIEAFERVDTGGDEVKIERVEALLLRARGLLKDVRCLKGIMEREKMKRNDKMMEEEEEEEIYLPLEVAKSSPPSSPVGGGGEKRLMRSAKESGIRELKSALQDAQRARNAVGVGKRVRWSLGAVQSSEWIEGEGEKIREAFGSKR